MADIKSTPRQRALTLPLLASTQFVLILDAAIVGVALPSMGAALGFAAADLSWVANAYILLFGGFLLLGGRVGDLIGRRRTFIIGVLAFTLSSFLGALAQDPLWLVGARAAQGLSAAFIAPSALALLLVTFPEGKERDRALGVWGAVAATGGAAGGLVGGVLTEWLGWASVLYVNVPIGLAVAWLATRILPADAADAADGRSGRALDLAGAMTVTAGIGIGIYALIDANDAGWTSPRTLLLAALAVSLVAAFVLIERRIANPLVPLTIFRDRLFRTANGIAVLNTMAMFPLFFLLTLYLQRTLGLSPLEAGLAFLPLSLTLLVSTLQGPRLVSRVGAGPALVGAMAVTAAGLAWFALSVADGSSPVAVVGPSFVTGLGAGVAWTASAVVATAGASPQDAGLRSGVLIASQQVGGAAGLAGIVALAVSLGGTALGPGVFTAGLQAGLASAAIIAALGALLALPLIGWRRPSTSMDPSRGSSGAALP